MYQVTADGAENVGCDDFLHRCVGFGFGEVVFGVGDGDEFGADMFSLQELVQALVALKKK